MRKIYLVMLTALITQHVHAQQDSVKTILDEVVISATRSTQEVLNTARSVEIIDHKEIRESAFNTVGELLARKGMIYVVGEGQTPGANQSLFLRGSNSNHTNILIDGIRITDPSTPNRALDLAELSLANIERIEIIRGSHSAIFGTGSIGGVVNIITKEAEEGLSGDISGQLGALGNGGLSHQTSAFLNYGYKGFYINGSFYNNNVNGLDASRDTVQTNDFRTADDDNFEKTDYSAKIGYKNDRIHAFIGYKKSDQRADIDDGAFQDDDNYFLEFERDLIQYGAGYQGEKWKVTFQGGFSQSKRLAVDDSSRIDDDGNFDQTFVSNRAEGKIYTNELLGSYQFKGIHTQFGLGIYDEAMNLNNYIYADGPFGLFEQETDYDSLDLSLETKYIFNVTHFDFGQLAGFNGFTLTLGSRYSEVSGGFNNFSFELSPAYRIGKTTFYASYAEGFNNPSLIQLYDPAGAFNFTTRGNPNLEAETSKTFEIGYKQLIDKQIALTIALYQTEVKNAIEYVYLWNGDTDIQNLSFADYLGDTYINVARQRVQGIELGVEGSLSKKIHFNLSFNFLDGEFEYSPEGIDTEYTGDNYVQLFSNGLFLNESKSSDALVRRPSYQGFFGLNYKALPALSVGANVRLVDARPDSFYDPALGPFGALNASPVDRYTLLGFNAKYQFREHLFATLRVENIADADYQEIAGFNTRGRSFYLKLGYRF